MFRKEIVCGIVILFLGASIVPSVGSESLKKECSLWPWHPGSDGIEISGTMGENGWYISNVQVTLEFPSYQIFWKIDDGGWIMYIGMPLIYPEEGLHTIYCYYIDDEGNPSETYSASFKIDKTPPMVTLETHRIGLFKILVSIDAYDNTSGVSGVIDIYLDYRLVGTITTPPYEFVIYTRLGKHTVDVIVYDCAGNSEESSISINSIKSQKSYPIQNNIQLLNNLLYKFIHYIEN